MGLSNDFLFIPIGMIIQTISEFFENKSFFDNPRELPVKKNCHSGMRKME